MSTRKFEIFVSYKSNGLQVSEIHIDGKFKQGFSSLDNQAKYRAVRKCKDLVRRSPALSIEITIHETKTYLL